MRSIHAERSAGPGPASAQVRSPPQRTLYILPTSCPAFTAPPSLLGPPKVISAEESSCSESQKTPRNASGSGALPVRRGKSPVTSLAWQVLSSPMAWSLGKSASATPSARSRATGPALTVTAPEARASEQQKAPRPLPLSSSSRGSSLASSRARGALASPRKSSVLAQSSSKTRMCTSGSWRLPKSTAKPIRHSGSAKSTLGAVWLLCARP
mmetsp:Transcript_55388/g.177707  ORF Transcript_55388/g.177707 Transcript_55388/m.177707 type:complete len:211 (-) Transcript_55388:130-762(-)